MRRDGPSCVFSKRQMNRYFNSATPTHSIYETSVAFSGACPVLAAWCEHIVWLLHAPPDRRTGAGVLDLLAGLSGCGGAWRTRVCTVLQPACGEKMKGG